MPKYSNNQDKDNKLVSNDAAGQNEENNSVKKVDLEKFAKNVKIPSSKNQFERSTSTQLFHIVDSILVTPLSKYGSLASGGQNGRRGIN